MNAVTAAGHGSGGSAASGTGGGGSGRTRARWFGRGRIVALEVAAGCALAGAAYGGTGGYAAYGAAAGIAGLALARWRGRSVTGHLVRRLRRGAFAVPAGTPASAGPELGLAGALFPALEITARADRNGPEVGVLCDGRGFAAVLELPAGCHPELPTALLGTWLARDPARPAAVQLLLEQHGVPPWDFHQRFSPTLAYRQLPAGPGPVTLRSWLVVRYEPWEAPEAAAARGGGAEGAHAAVAAATTRLRALLATHGVTAHPLDAEAVRALLRQVGDPEPRGRAAERAWEGAAATHCLLGARPAGPEEWRALLGAVAATATDRAVIGATVSLATPPGSPASGPEAEPDHVEVRCAVRLVGTVTQQVTAARDRLLATRVTSELTGHQTAGLIATLPLAHPARSLVEATGFGTGRDER